MTPELKKLLKEARNRVMSDEERWRQRCSFAYGNCNLANPDVTRELIEEVARNHNHVDREIIEE